MARTGQTEIINAALALLGTGQRVSSIDAGSPIANAAKDVWGIVVREVMVAHPWNFAVTRTELTPAAPRAIDGNVRASVYPYSYALPADCLRWLPPDDRTPDWFRGEQEGGFLVASHEGPITIRYIAEVLEVGRWSPGFVSAVTARLAWYLSEAATASQSIRDRMLDEYDEAMRRAKRQDGLATGTRRERHVVRSRWAGYRGAGGGHRWPYGPCDDD